MKDIDMAVELLESKELSLAVVRDGNVIFASGGRGINPLYEALEEHKDELEGSSVADRVTGRAAAMICAHAGIKELKTKLISDNAINVLKETNILYEYDERTPFIKNRDKTGMCPIEMLSLKCGNFKELSEKISDFLQGVKEAGI